MINFNEIFSEAREDLKELSSKHENETVINLSSDEIEVILSIISEMRNDKIREKEMEEKVPQQIREKIYELAEKALLLQIQNIFFDKFLKNLPADE